MAEAGNKADKMDQNDKELGNLEEYSINFLEKPYKDHFALHRTIRENWVSGKKNIRVFPTQIYIGSYVFNRRITGRRLVVDFRPEVVTFSAPHCVTKEETSIGIPLFDLMKVFLNCIPNPKDPDCCAVVHLHIDPKLANFFKQQLGMDDSPDRKFTPWHNDLSTRYIIFVILPYPKESVAQLKELLRYFMDEATDAQIKAHTLEKCQASKQKLQIVEIETMTGTKPTETDRENTVLLSATADYTEVLLHDVKKMAIGTGWLNDKMLDFAISFELSKLLPEDLRRRIAIYPAEFFGRYVANKQRNSRLGPECIERKLCRISDFRDLSFGNSDIFTKDYILIPVNHLNHWWLAIVCFPGLNIVGVQQKPAKRGGRKQATNTELRRTCILLLNSLDDEYGKLNPFIESILREHLNFEHQECIKEGKLTDTQGPKYFFNQERVPCWKPTVQQQLDRNSCGIYIWKYAVGFFTTLPNIATPTMNLVDLPGTDKKSIMEGRQKLFTEIYQLVMTTNPNGFEVLLHMINENNEKNQKKKEENEKSDQAQFTVSAILQL